MERKSNIELLRIISMFMIVMHHFLVHGDLWMLPASVNKDIVNFFVPFGKICFDAFVAISCWFIVKSKFKADRFVRIWLQVLFYNVVFTVAAWIIAGDVSNVNGRVVFGSFMPILGNSHGFASAYLVFYLLIPVLKKIQESLNQRQTLFVLLVLGITQVAVPYVGTIIGYTQPLQSEFLLFVLVYFIAYYLQNWPVKLLSSVWFLSLALIVILTLIIGSNMVSQYHSHVLISLVNYGAYGEFGFLNIATGFLLFLLFDKINIPHSKAINFIATTVFGVLLFHDHNYFRGIIWRDLKTLYDWNMIGSLKFLAVIFAASVGVFVVGALIEFFRQILIEKPLMKARFIKKIISLLDQFADLSVEDKNLK